MEHTALTQLILQLNRLLDTGKYDDITIEEVHKHIENGSILQFLQERAGDDIDLLIHMDPKVSAGFQDFYVKYLQNFYHTFGGGEDWFVKNKGLCLLIAWTNEIIQRGIGLRPKEDMI